MDRERLRGDSPELLTKQCMMYGKEFTTYRIQRNVCSDECKKGRAHKYYLERKNDFFTYNSKYHKAMYSYKTRSKCLICGEPVVNDFGVTTRRKTRMHEICIVKDALSTLRSGQEISDTQLQRLRTRGLGRKYMKNLLRYLSGNKSLEDEVYDEHKNL